MSSQDETPSYEPKPAASEGRKTKSAAEPTAPATLVSLTVDTQSGRILKIETVEPGGARKELTDEGRAALARAQARATVEGVIEQAFEAGIDCVLGVEDEEAPESDEDAELRRLLLRSLIRQSAAQQLVQHDVLSRAIVGSLIRQAADGDEAPHDGAIKH